MSPKHPSLDYVSGRPRVVDYREVVAAFQAGTTNVSELARRFDVDRHTIRRALRAAGATTVKLGGAPSGQRSAAHSDPVVWRYHAGHPIREICQEHGIGRSTVYRRLADAGVPVARHPGRMMLTATA